MEQEKRLGVVGCSTSNPCLIDEHEMIIVAHKINARLSNQMNVEKELFMSCMHSVWKIHPESAKKIGHTAPYPVEIPYRIIKFYSSRNGIILDPFMGSGTTGVACIKTGKKFIGIELDPTYFSLAEKRIHDAQQQMRLF